MENKPAKQHSFFNSAILYTLGVILAQGVTFLLQSILFPRLFGNAADITLTGLYALWANVFASLIGLEAASSLNNARLKFGTDSLNKYTSSLIGIGLIMLGVFACVVFIFQGAVTSLTKFPLQVAFSFLLQGFFYFCIMLIAQRSRVTNKPLQFILWTALVCVLRLVFSTLFISHMQADQYIGDVYGSLLAYALVGTAAIVVLLKNGRAVGNRKYWKYCLLLTLPIVFHTLSSLVLSQSDQLMLQHMVGEGRAAPYTYAYGISALANAVWLAFNNAWTVWYFDKTHENKTGEILDLYKKYAGFVTLFTVTVIMVAPDLLLWFGGESLAAGRQLIPIMMLGCFFMFLYTFPVGYETYKHKTKYIAVGTVAAAALNIGLNFYFIPRWGILGAAITTLISYAMLFVFHYIIARFIIKDFQIGFRSLLIPAAFMAGVVALTYVTMELAVLRWILAIAALAAAFVVYRKSRHIMM